MTTTRLAQVTGICGLIAVVLLFGSTVTIATLGEPGFVTTPATAQSFFGRAGAPWAQVVSTFTGLAGIALLWFVAGFTTLLHRREPGVPWLSITALGSGIIVAGYAILDASWETAAFTGPDLEPAIAKYAFDAGNLAFANTWLAIASLAISAGWAVLTSHLFARWMGWWAIVAGAGLIASRFVWTNEIWLAPYALFWLWVITVSIQLITQPGRVDPVASRQVENGSWTTSAVSQRTAGTAR